ARCTDLHTAPDSMLDVEPAFSDEHQEEHAARYRSGPEAPFRQVREDRPNPGQDHRSQEDRRAVQEYSDCAKADKEEMIDYRPTDGDPQTSPFNYRPRTCVIRTQLGGRIPAEVARVREVLDSVFRVDDFDCIDATSVVTGKDFLLKI